MKNTLLSLGSCPLQMLEVTSEGATKQRKYTCYEIASVHCVISNIIQNQVIPKVLTV